MGEGGGRGGEGRGEEGEEGVKRRRTRVVDPVTPAIFKLYWCALSDPSDPKKHETFFFIRSLPHRCDFFVADG